MFAFYFCNQARELGNPKIKKGKEVPPNYEVCEPCKLHLDAGEEVPLPLLAKLMKFRLMAIKATDMKRMEVERKVTQALTFFLCKCVLLLVLLLLIMKNNFNRRSSHSHHGSKRHELAQHVHSRGSYTFTHTLTSAQSQPLCVKRQLSYYRIWNQFFCFEGTRGRGSKPEHPEKTSDSLPAKRYHIRGENSKSRAGIKPSPSNIGDKLAWPRACAACDPLSYRLLPLMSLYISTTCN